jgi:ribosome recycling factor
MSLENIDEKMDKVVERLEVNFSEIRAGRANPAILNKVQVEYYGAMSPLTQIASVSVPEARLIVIQPWDKSLLSQIVRAIEMAEIGINPMNDGQVIRLNFPELTEERRKDLVKEVKKLSEESKVAIRNVRRDEMDLVKAQLKNSEISEDEAKADEAKIQKKTDDYVAKIEEITAKKEKDIMTV